MGTISNLIAAFEVKNVPKQGHAEGPQEAPWALAVTVASQRGSPPGPGEERVPTGRILVGLSDANGEHAAGPHRVGVRLVRGSADPEHDTVFVGNGTRTVHAWARTEDGRWATRGDQVVNVQSGARAQVRLTLEPFVATVALFRGNNDLPVVPFSSSHEPGTLDSALGNDHGVPGPPVRPPARDPEFTFPGAGAYADSAPANADPGLFRVRVTLDRLPDDPPPQIPATLKVQWPRPPAGGAGAPTFEPVPGWNGAAHTAVHPDGLEVTLQRRGADAVWESPYMRVATLPDVLTPRFQDPGHVLVHSLPPAPPPRVAPAVPGPTDRDLEQAGRQFGRRLVVEGVVGAAVAAGPRPGVPFRLERTLGGDHPYARIPLRFFWPWTNDPPQRLARCIPFKVNELNAWWAAHGLEFHLQAQPVERIAPPQRRLLTLGEHTGRDRVCPSDVAFEVTIRLRARPTPPQPAPAAAPAFEEVAVAVTLPAGATPDVAADAIEQAIRGVAFAAPLQGVQLTVQRTAHPARVFMPCLLTFGAENPLDVLGTCGPIDLLIVPTNLPAGGVQLEIVGLAAVPRPAVAARVVAGRERPDLCAPFLGKPYTDASFLPYPAPTRQWARSFGGGPGALGEGAVAVVVLSGELWSRKPGFPSSGRGPQVDGTPLAATEVDLLCAALGAGGLLAEHQAALRPGTYSQYLVDEIGRGGASTLLDFGLFAAGRFTIFLNEDFLKAVDGGDKGSTFAHEVGHALGDLDHVLGDPSWFYEAELMHINSQRTCKITRTKVWVDRFENRGGWKYLCVELPEGYGKAIRDRIQRTDLARPAAGKWIVDANAPRWR